MWVCVANQHTYVPWTTSLDVLYTVLPDVLYTCGAHSMTTYKPEPILQERNLRYISDAKGEGLTCRPPLSRYPWGSLSQGGYQRPPLCGSRPARSPCSPPAPSHAGKRLWPEEGGGRYIARVLSSACKGEGTCASCSYTYRDLPTLVGSGRPQPPLRANLPPFQVNSSPLRLKIWLKFDLVPS